MYSSTMEFVKHLLIFIHDLSGSPSLKLCTSKVSDFSIAARYTCGIPVGPLPIPCYRPS